MLLQRTADEFISICHNFVFLSLFHLQVKWEKYSFICIQFGFAFVYNTYKSLHYLFFVIFSCCCCNWARLLTREFFAFKTDRHRKSSVITNKTFVPDVWYCALCTFHFYYRSFNFQFIPYHSMRIKIAILFWIIHQMVDNHLLYIRYERVKYKEIYIYIHISFFRVHLACYFFFGFTIKSEQLI